METVKEKEHTVAYTLPSCIDDAVKHYVNQRWQRENTFIVKWTEEFNQIWKGRKKTYKILVVSTSTSCFKSSKTACKLFWFILVMQVCFARVLALWKSHVLRSKMQVRINHSEICIQTPFIRQPLILRGSLAQEHCSMSLQYHVQMPFWKDFSEISTTKTFWKYNITDHTQL